jgi:hypothetical protein
MVEKVVFASISSTRICYGIKIEFLIETLLMIYPGYQIRALAVLELLFPIEENKNILNPKQCGQFIHLVPLYLVRF